MKKEKEREKKEGEKAIPENDKGKAQKKQRAASARKKKHTDHAKKWIRNEWIFAPKQTKPSSLPGHITSQLETGARLSASSKNREMKKRREKGNDWNSKHKKKGIFGLVVIKI